MCSCVAGTCSHRQTREQRLFTATARSQLRGGHVDVGHALGHGVLNLQPRVELEEEELVVLSSASGQRRGQQGEGGGGREGGEGGLAGQLTAGWYIHSTVPADW